MITFAEFLAEAARKGELVNTMFEERLFDLVGTLAKITDALAAADIPHEVVGGLAVLIHVEAADPTHAMLTRDVDVMVRREDLERVKEAAAKSGFRFRHSAGLDMLLSGPEDTAKNAVHLLFSGEKVRLAQPMPHPPISPELKSILGKEVPVVPIVDLVRMKLSAYRDKDRVHVRSMDAAGLITPELEVSLPVELRSRLQHIRETE